MTTNRYLHGVVEICRDCDGEGIRTTYAQWDRLHQHPTTDTCALCEGTGRVRVSKKIEVTVVAFKARINYDLNND
jgi:DnaJ-class molecular chaperone